MVENLKPLKIGGIVVDFPVVLAPLAGYSDLSYRLICRSLSAPYCTTEAMLDKHIIVDGKLRRKLIMTDDADHPVAGQIMGSRPVDMAAAAAVLREAGFDAIDLNFACPVRKVLARRRGGYLMSQPDLALEMVAAVRAAVPDRPVTVKMRQAFDESNDSRDAFWRIARGAFEAGAAAVCVHARSVQQKYRGQADWEFLRDVKRAFPDHTIIGSGDALSAAEALKMLRETGVDAIGAARGAIGNPWFFRQARDVAAGRAPHQPTLEEQAALIARHYRLACDLYGPERGLKVMRNFAIHYARLHPRPSETRHAVLRVKKEAEWRAFLDEHYQMPAPEA
jgi:tRNA-dihydrouridine synthase B